MEGLEDGCVGMDRAGVVRIFNPRAEALLGVRAREVVGRVREVFREEGVLRGGRGRARRGCVCRREGWRGGRWGGGL
ncbi:MAG: hypothetical protein K6U88_17260, partial [Dehalococcoidia bacterium]|nr:hypothetical protein [Dehalococcoidia bacterium]